MSGVNDIRSVFPGQLRCERMSCRSSPWCRRNDLTSTFTNAGMVQLKMFFTGLEEKAARRSC